MHAGTRRAHLGLAIASALIGAFAFASAASAAKPEIFKKPLSNRAADGYDVVAYFTEGNPVKGAAEFSTTWKGAEWRFASKENLEKFKTDPESYAPQYGGYCAWAISQNYTAPGNPQNWTVFEGKLYFNYNDEIQARWSKDIKGFIVKADANWPKALE